MQKNTTIARWRCPFCAAPFEQEFDDDPYDYLENPWHWQRHPCPSCGKETQIHSVFRPLDLGKYVPVVVQIHKIFVSETTVLYHDKGDGRAVHTHALLETRSDEETLACLPEPYRRLPMVEERALNRYYARMFFGVEVHTSVPCPAKVDPVPGMVLIQQYHEWPALVKILAVQETGDERRVATLGLPSVSLMDFLLEAYYGESLREAPNGYYACLPEMAQRIEEWLDPETFTVWFVENRATGEMKAL